MNCGSVLQLAMLILCMGSLSHAQDGAGRRIVAGEFPELAQRVEFFEQRINSPSPKLRIEALREVGYFRMLADVETERFLRRMMEDPEPVVRGNAIKVLYDLWVRIEPRELPTKFSSYFNGQMIDLENPGQVKELIEQCTLTNTGPGPGYAAYVLGLIRSKEAAPALMKLAAHPNVFVRYTAGRSLAEMGDPAGAKILEAVAQAELATYARLTDRTAAVQEPAPTRQPFYAMASSFALIKLADQEKTGVDHLIDLMAFVENSRDPNDEASRSRVQRMIAGVAGKWFDRSKEAREWFALKYRR